MIDTGRHYLGVETILTMIDAISYNKVKEDNKMKRKAWRVMLVLPSPCSPPFLLFHFFLHLVTQMNTLHWHITDSQSFPMQSTSHPNLAIDGSYQYPRMSKREKEGASRGGEQRGEGSIFILRFFSSSSFNFINRGYLLA